MLGRAAVGSARSSPNLQGVYAMSDKRATLLIQMSVKFGIGLLGIATILFGCAGSLSYANGWVFMVALGSPIALFGLFLWVTDPRTLARRLQSKEPDFAQKINITTIGIIFVATFAIAGLDFRWGWSRVPPAASRAALVVMLLGYALFIAVVLQNAYASRVVEVAENQQIITGGLYSVVRHPMYAASLLIFLSMPMVLGSYWGLMPMLIYPAIIIRRIKSEEALLTAQLPGYADYINTVKYRLLPFLW